MKFEKEINEIKQSSKVYLTFRSWDCCLRRATPRNFALLDSKTAEEKIINVLPNVCEITIDKNQDYPYPLVEVHL